MAAVVARPMPDPAPLMIATSPCMRSWLIRAPQMKKPADGADNADKRGVFSVKSVSAAICVICGSVLVLRPPPLSIHVKHFFHQCPPFARGAARPWLLAWIRQLPPALGRGV